jgi:hypothetical protein
MGYRIVRRFTVFEFGAQAASGAKPKSASTEKPQHGFRAADSCAAAGRRSAGPSAADRKLDPL